MFGKGGATAAFFLCFFAVSVLACGGSLQKALAVLRVAGFGAAFLFLWHRRQDGHSAPGYLAFAGTFALFCLAHSLFSTYFWVSFQHAVNVLLAVVVLAWAVSWLRNGVADRWDRLFRVVVALALVEAAVAALQRWALANPRPHGTFDNPNYLAEFLAAAALLCLGSLLKGGQTHRKRIALGLAAVLLLWTALGGIGSRGVLVALVPAAGILAVWRFGWKRGALLAAACVPVLLTVGWRSFDRFFSPDVYGYGRWIIWKAALKTAFDHPFGVGLGCYKYFWFANQAPVEGAFRRFGKVATTAHSEYLEVLAGLGVIGFAGFVSSLAYPMLAAWRRRRTIPEESGWIAASAASVLVLSGIHAAFETNFHEFGIVFLDALCVGALLSVISGGLDRRLRVPGWVAWPGMIACTVLLAASLQTVAAATSHELGEDRLRKGDAVRAESFFRFAALADPVRAPYPDALSALAYRRFQRERNRSGSGAATVAHLDDAIGWERRAFTLNSMEQRYALRLSHLHAERFRSAGGGSDLAQAFGYAKTALEINPYSLEALWHRGGLFLEFGTAEDAAKDLRRAVALEPNFCRGYAKLSEIMTASNPAEALDWKAKAEACRRAARGRRLEDFEAWLVGPMGED